MASGCAARFRATGEAPFESARSWLSSLATSARVDRGEPENDLLALFVFPFDVGRAAGTDRDLHEAWIPGRVERHDPAGRVIVVEWDAVEEDAETTDRVARASVADEEEWTREEWTRAVDFALERIRAGALRKVVLSRSRRVRGSYPYDPDRIFHSLRDAYPECHRYRYEPGDGSVFLGASPERLVALRGSRIEADAVAGTAADPRTLLEDPKERLEHGIVVEEVLAALRPVTENLEADSLPSMHRLRNVTHLRTRVHATARPGAHVLELAARLHPSPAVAGAPRDAALDLIRTLEPRPRGWYAGPIGWASAAGDGAFTLGLRGALLRGSEALLHAGAGIVLGSDPDREWDETEFKMRAMEDALRG